MNRLKAKQIKMDELLASGRSPVIIHLNGKTYLYDKDMDDANQKYDEYRASQVRCDAIPLVRVDDGQEMNLSHFIDDYGISGKDARQVIQLEVGQTIVVQDMNVTRTR